MCHIPITPIPIFPIATMFKLISQLKSMFIIQLYDRQFKNSFLGLHFSNHFFFSNRMYPEKPARATKESRNHRKRKKFMEVKAAVIGANDAQASTRAVNQYFRTAFAMRKISHFCANVKLQLVNYACTAGPAKKEKTKKKKR